LRYKRPFAKILPTAGYPTKKFPATLTVRFRFNLIAREMKLKKITVLFVAAMLASSHVLAQTPGSGQTGTGAGGGGGAGAGAAVGAGVGGLGIGALAAIALGIAALAAIASDDNNNVTTGTTGTTGTR